MIYPVISAHRLCPVLVATSIAGVATSAGWLWSGEHLSRGYASAASAGPRCAQNYNRRPLLLDIACPGTRLCYAAGAGPCVGGAAVLRSADGGRAWQTQRNPLTRNPNVALQHIACPGPWVCFATGTAASILATFDGGRTWHSQRNPLSGTYRTIYGIACPSVTTCYAVADHRRIFVTHDGGRTWRDQSNPLKANSYPRKLACPAIAVCYIVGGGFDMSGRSHSTIVATASGGRSWRQQSAGTNDGLFGIACPTTDICYAVGATGTVLRTSNGGRTWSVQRKSLNPFDYLDDIACPDARTCYAVGGLRSDPSRTRFVVLATRDGGTTWTFQRAPLGETRNFTYVHSIACPSALTCYVVGGSRIGATTDGGKTWHRLFIGPSKDQREVSAA